VSKVVRVHVNFLKPKRRMMVVRQDSELVQCCRIGCQVSVLMQNVIKNVKDQSGDEDT
jgi:hypothetical protein